MDNQDKKLNLEEILGEVDEKFRRGMSRLTDWTEQTRGILQNRPGVVLASIAIAGFMTGLITRRGGMEKMKKSFSADPLIVFLTGAFAGFTIGPRILDESSGRIGSRDGQVYPMEKHSPQHH